MRRILSLATIPLLMAPFTGCRNPFDPSADVIIDHFEPRMGSMKQGEWNNEITRPGASWAVQAQYVTVFIRNYSTVGVSFSSYTVVYRQVSEQAGAIPPLPAHSPITAAGGAEGLTFKFVAHLLGLQYPNNEGQERSWNIQVVTDDLLRYCANTETQSGGIDCEITMHGTDHNGHDVTVSGVWHLEVF